MATHLHRPKKGRTAAPHFSANILWPNGWMDQDTTWYKGGLGPGHIVLDGNSASPKTVQPPNFQPMSIVDKRSPISATAQQLLKYDNSNE